MHTPEVSFKEFKEVTKGMCAQCEFDTRENIRPTVYLLEFYSANEEAGPNSVATENVKCLSFGLSAGMGKWFILDPPAAINAMRK